MSQFYHNSPARSDAAHIENQKPGMEAAHTRFCSICKRARSVAQFWNAKKSPVFKFCATCRGAK